MSAEEPIALRQQRDLSELFQDAITLYSQRFWSLFAIAAVIIPFVILTGIVSNEFAPTLDFPAPLRDGTAEEMEAYNEAVKEVFKDLGIIVAVVGPPTLLQLFVQWLASLAIIATLAGLHSEPTSELSHARRQSGNTFTRSYGAVFARFSALIGALLRKWVVILPLGITGIGIPAAIYFWIRWRFAYQAVILDSTSSKAALSYSAHAVSDRWWRTLGITILITIVVQVPGQLVGAFFGLAPMFVSSVVTALMTAALLPLGVIAMTLLYFDLKLRKESDVVLSPA